MNQYKFLKLLKELNEDRVAMTFGARDHIDLNKTIAGLFTSQELERFENSEMILPDPKQGILWTMFKQAMKNPLWEEIVEEGLLHDGIKTFYDEKPNLRLKYNLIYFLYCLYRFEYKVAIQEAPWLEGLVFWLSDIMSALIPLIKSIPSRLLSMIVSVNYKQETTKLEYYSTLVRKDLFENPAATVACFQGRHVYLLIGKVKL